MSVSVVVPTYNEVDNVGMLHEQLTEVLARLNRDYELLFVDDGSNDGTIEELRKLAGNGTRTKIVQFRRNYGQTAAMHAGIQLASRDVIITLDADLQNDPADIPMMLAKLDEGYDLVHGWRRQRQDHWLTRTLPSRIANALISKTTGFPIHDLGCTLKAIRREIAQELELHGEMHRFIPILAHQRGARCAEVVTRHHPRRFGQTKYGINRTFRVILDLITVKFLLDYSASPMKLFGRFAAACGAIAGVCGVLTVLMKLFAAVAMASNPAVPLGVLSAMEGVQFLGLGLLAEFNTRIHYGARSRQHYAIRELVNFDDTSETLTHPAARAA